MSKCPKCGTEELNWDKTKNGKNWLKDVTGNWHTCITGEKPKEVSASTLPTQPEPTLEEKKNGKNYYHCPLCPKEAGWLFKLDREAIALHNSSLHPQGQDYSKVDLKYQLEIF